MFQKSRIFISSNVLFSFFLLNLGRVLGSLIVSEILYEVILLSLHAPDPTAAKGPGLPRILENNSICVILKTKRLSSGASNFHAIRKLQVNHQDADRATVMTLASQ